MPPAIIYRALAIVVSFLPVRFRAKMWMRLVKAGKKKWEVESTTQRIPGGMYVKARRVNGTSEGKALRFVGSHTSLPVPVVIDTFIDGDVTVLVMSRMPGHSLAGVYKQITPEVEHILSAQLSRILAPLRAITPSSQAVCSFEGPVHCERISLGSAPTGPWDSIAAFHEELVQRVGEFVIPENEEKSEEAIRDVIRRAHSRTHRICLTHNDLGPHNVLVDDKWNITGIIDWEACAWMPEYWELTKATFLPWFRKGRWFRIMTEAFPTYALEQEAERYIVNYRKCYV